MIREFGALGSRGWGLIGLGPEFWVSATGFTCLNTFLYVAIYLFLRGVRGYRVASDVFFQAEALAQ